MTRPDELKLIALLKEGNEEAFTSIYKQYKPGLEQFLLRRGTGREDVEDIVQEVFASLWKRRKELKVASSLEGFLIQAVRYKGISLFTKNKNTTERHVIYEQLQEVKTMDAQTKQELCEWLLHEVDQVADDIERMVFKEVFENGEKPKEVAAKLAIKPRNVRRIISKLCKSLGILTNKQQ